MRFPPRVHRSLTSGRFSIFRCHRVVADDGDAHSFGRGAAAAALAPASAPAPAAAPAPTAAALDTQEAPADGGRGSDRAAGVAAGGRERRLQGGTTPARGIRRRRRPVLPPGRKHRGHRVIGHDAAAAAAAQVSATRTPPSPPRRGPPSPAAAAPARHHQEARGRRFVSAARVHVLRAGHRARARRASDAAAAPHVVRKPGRGRDGCGGGHQDGRGRGASRLTLELRPPAVVRHGNRPVGQRSDQDL